MSQSVCYYHYIAITWQQHLYVDWDELISNENTECAWKKFKDILHKLIEKNIPLQCVSKTKTSSNPWITKASKRLISKRNRAWRKYRESKTESDYSTYKRIRNDANRKVKLDQASYRKRILKSFKGNPKKFYGYMRRQKIVKERVHPINVGNGKLTNNDKETAQALGDFFSSVFVRDNDSPDKVNENTADTKDLLITVNRSTVMNKLKHLKVDKAQGPDDIHPAVLRNCAQSVSWPLAIIFQKSLTEGVLPTDWKLATVVPIFKKGNKHEASNYRPVSLTAVPCKVLESIIKDAVVCHLDLHNFQAKCQHGFVKGWSTLTNLLETLESWTRILEEGLGLDIIYLDYRKAFDSFAPEAINENTKFRLG